MSIPKITDVYVSIDVTHPQINKDLKKIAIFTKGNQESFKTYEMLEDVMADYDANTSVYKMAETIFSQDDAPEAIQVISYSDKAPAPMVSSGGGQVSNDDVATKFGAPASGIGRAAFDYFYEDWEIAILADYSKADALALADVIEHGGYDGKGFHMMFQQFGPSNASDHVDFDKYNRTWCYYHTNEDEYYAAGLAGEGTSETIGKQSWKFVSDLNNVTPETLNASQILDLENQGFICYVSKGDHANQTDDKNKQGLYIDFIHGLDFVKSNVETNLQNALSIDGKNTFTFGPKGLGAVKTNLETSLNQAGANGIIAADSNNKYEYSYDIPDINKIPQSNIERRILNGIKFSYTASSAINEIHVNGTSVA